jgi:hypothetical protein
MKQPKPIPEILQSIRPGDTIYTILRHVSPSGMTRWIAPVIYQNGDPRYLSYAIAETGLYPYDRNRDALKVSGCGMDMGFDVVYNLGRTLFPDGFGLPIESVPDVPGYPPQLRIGLLWKRPQSKEQAAKYIADGVTFKRGRNGDTSGWDSDGGYALVQRWL